MFNDFQLLSQCYILYKHFYYYLVEVNTILNRKVSRNVIALFEIRLEKLWQIKPRKPSNQCTMNVYTLLKM